MSSDRARISYDPSRAYRGVIAQQGRVTLEADLNEESMIAREALRLETIDIIGPAGTCDNGYQVTGAATPAQVTVGEGTYYLGGWRLTLEEPVALGQQPDWLDAPPLAGGKTMLVALLVTEQSVSAVEDQALREVALGGPDTGARYRLLQQFPLIAIDGDTCETAAAILAKDLAAQGVTIDPATAALSSDARLLVDFAPNPAPTDPCTPAAAGGYLGADNQLIRVSVIAYEAATNAGRLVWGRNNASIVYRATSAPATATVLTLQGVPIDEEHTPQLGQAVEILRSRAELKDGSYTPSTMAERNFVAADSGFVTTIAAQYTKDQGTLTLTDPLPPEYANDPNPLFLRLWDAIVPFNGGAATPLDATNGVRVTVTLSALPRAPVARPFWRFAVRPDTPAQVYPVRFREGPQPPDGARQWLGDLAVVGYGAGQGIDVLADCRPSFDPLTKDKCDCCGLTLDLRGVDARGGLQAVVDSLKGRPAVLTLKPGNYVLHRPLTLTGAHARLVIEGCGYGTTISAEPKLAKSFVHGLIVIEQSDAITLRRLDFDVPMVPAGKDGGTFSGVMVAESGLVVIEDCTFTLHVPRSGKIAGQVFGGGITIAGRAAELSVRRNRFTGTAIVPNGPVCGVLAAVNTKTLSTVLGGVAISDNVFERLNGGIVAFARLGDVRCSANRMRECNTGIFLADPVMAATNAFAKEAFAQGENRPELAQLVEHAYPTHFLVALSTDVLARKDVGETAAASPSRAARTALLRDMAASGDKAFAAVAAAFPQVSATRTRAAAPSAAERRKTAEDRTQLLGDLTHLDGIALGIQLAAPQLATVLHIEHNDIALINTAASAKPGVGIAILRAPGDDPSMVLMSANRVTAGDNRTLAGSLMFATMAAVTGNIMVHATGDPKRELPAFVAFGVDGGHYAFNGNVFQRGAKILPPRTSPPPSAADYWPSLNTEA